LNSFKRYC